MILGAPIMLRGIGVPAAVSAFASAGRFTPWLESLTAQLLSTPTTVPAGTAVTVTKFYPVVSVWAVTPLVGVIPLLGTRQPNITDVGRSRGAVVPVATVFSGTGRGTGIIFVKFVLVAPILPT